MTKTLLILMLVLFSQLACGTAMSQNEMKTSGSEISSQKVVEKQEEDCGKIKFRYLIMKDHLMSDSIRQIWVFLDPKAFSEENLKILFTSLSKKYAQPEGLIITVETDWDRIQFPDACIRATSEAPYNPKENDYHRAVFRRIRSSASFNYNPVLKTSNFKTVKLESGDF